MKNILIVSATSGTNLVLAKSLLNIVDAEGALGTIVNLEDYNLPLYTPSAKLDADVGRIKDALIESDGYIVCAPEYNGSIPPIVTNAIAWISVSTDGWRDAFNNKFALIASSSGGPGGKYLIAMKAQLEHLGSIVLPRAIMTSSSKPLDPESAKKIISRFISYL